jgi:hypothetical protein
MIKYQIITGSLVLLSLTCWGDGADLQLSDTSSFQPVLEPVQPQIEQAPIVDVSPSPGEVALFWPTAQASHTNVDRSNAKPESTSVQNVHGTWEGRVAPHTENKSWFLTADFLYWQAKEDGLEYALESKIITSDPFTVESDLHDLDFNWNPGFRAGLGYIFGNHDQWDLSLIYTYMRNDGHGSKSTNDLQEDPLSAMWAPFVLGPFALEAKAHWHLSFNVLDCELGRNYFISKNIALHPHMGLRGAFIYQNYKADYVGVFRFTNGALSGNTNYKADNDFKGVGLRAGTDFLWHFSSHWGLFGKAAGALFYGHFHLEEDFRGLSLSGQGGSVSLNERNVSSSRGMMRTRFNVDASIGIQWETFFSKKKRHLTLNLGYDLSHWFNQNELRAVTIVFDTQSLGGGVDSQIQAETFNNSSGSLGLQGVSFNVRYDY